MKLDRTRPYGEIFGGTGGAKYEQDNKLFTADGDAIGDQQAPAIPDAPSAPADAPRDAAPAPAPAPSAEPARRGNKKRPV